jgi:subtilase family serine protease
MKKFFAACAAAVVLLVSGIMPAHASYHFASYLGTPPIHVFRSAQKSPTGLTPLEIKHIYHLPLSGGASSTIALVEAYSSPTLEADLGVFNDTYNLPACTIKNGCLEMHPMDAGIKTNSGWALETALDVEWAHAIAPQAKDIGSPSKDPERREFARRC